MEKPLLKKKSVKTISDSGKHLEDISGDCPEPSAQAINNILNYSKALSIRESKLVKHIETILN